MNLKNKIQLEGLKPIKILLLILMLIMLDNLLSKILI